MNWPLLTIGILICNVGGLVVIWNYARDRADDLEDYVQRRMDQWEDEVLIYLDEEHQRVTRLQDEVTDKW